MTEAFACGTAAVMAPGRHGAWHRASEWPVGDGRPGPVTLRLREELLGIEYGRVADTRGWLHRVA